MILNDLRLPYAPSESRLGKKAAGQGGKDWVYTTTGGAFGVKLEFTFSLNLVSVHPCRGRELGDSADWKIAQLGQD